jgi:hypothetical protein
VDIFQGERRVEADACKIHFVSEVFYGMQDMTKTYFERDWFL